MDMDLQFLNILMKMLKNVKSLKDSNEGFIITIQIDLNKKNFKKKRCSLNNIKKCIL